VSTLPAGEALMAVGFRFTQADFDRLPEIEGIRYELIDGELYMSTQPAEPHQYTCMVLTTDLAMWSRQSGAGMVIPAPGLVFPNDDNVAPDLVWISFARRALALDASGHYRLAPEIVVEVLSPGGVNERRDREVKLDLYSRRNVQEYWIADWQNRTLEVYRHDGVALRLERTLTNGDLLTSPILSGFSCQVETLWAPSLNS
jgi:Uma2 family endonuclease